MNGISIIMATQASELDELDTLLGVESVWLNELAQHHLRDPQTVYRSLLPDVASMKAVASLLNIKRGILFVAGKAEFIGFNRDWMTKALIWQDQRKSLPPAEVPRPTLSTLWERDDPWTSLGYSR